MRGFIKAGLFAAVVTSGIAVPKLASAADAWLSGGTAWKYRRPVTLTEPGIAGRTNEYVDVLVDVSGAPFTDLAKEVRVADPAGAEIPSLVWGIDAGAKTAHVVFPRTIAKSATEKVYVYWSNAAAPAPAYTFPAAKVAFYAYDPVQAAYEDHINAGMTAMQAYGKIPIALTRILYSGYSATAAYDYRLGIVHAFCTVHDYLKNTSIYGDIALWGLTDGNCLEQYMFGLTDGGTNGTATIPATTTYVTQDFAPNAALGFSCQEAALPDAASINEVFSGATSASSCHIRWEPGHALPNAKTLKYRSYFTGRATVAWTADEAKIYQRSMEMILQDNRVTTSVGTGEGGMECFVDADKDGFGSTTKVFAFGETSCNQPAKGYADNGDDCDDTKAAVKPGAAEVCDGLDNDCDGNVDDGGDALCGNATSGKICSVTQKKCVDGCAVAAAPPDGGADAGAGIGPRNGCPDPLFCTAKTPGAEGTCTKNCTTDVECAAELPAQPFCLDSGSAGKLCGECRNDADCGKKPGTTCNATTHACEAKATAPDGGTSSSSSSSSGSSSGGVAPDGGASGGGASGDDGGCGCHATSASDTASSAPFFAVFGIVLARILKRRPRR